MKNTVLISTCCIYILVNTNFNAYTLTAPSSYKIKPATIYTKDFNQLYFLLSMGYNIHELELQHKQIVPVLPPARNNPLIMNFNSLYGAIGIGYGANYKSLYGSIECMLDISKPANKAILIANSNGLFNRDVQITHNFVKPNLGVRIGYLKNDWLLYTKLGITRNSSTITDLTYPANVTAPANMVRYMPTITIGIEHSFSKKFSFRIEGEFTKSNFGDKINTYTVNANPPQLMKFRSNNLNIKFLLSYYYNRRLKRKYL